MEKNFKETAKKVADKGCCCAEKGWAYAKRYFDLKERLMASWVVPVLQKRLNVIYTIGLCILAIWAVLSIATFDISDIIVGLAGVSLTFIIFRTLCEIVAACPAEKKAAPASEKKAEKAAAVKKSVKVEKTEKPAKPKKAAKRKTKKAKKTAKKA